MTHIRVDGVFGARPRHRVRRSCIADPPWFETQHRHIAEAGKAPRPRLVVRPRDAVQWALYYPPLIDYRIASTPAPAGTAIQGALEHYRRGKLPAAFALLEAVPSSQRDADYHTLRAGLLRTVGRVQEARSDIAQALGLDPRNSTAYALSSIVAVVQNDRDKALTLAQKAAQLDPQAALARIDPSYAYQARFDMERALKEVKQATQLAPADPLAWARRSDLELSLGHLDQSLASARRAIALDPDLARTQIVLGFAHLTQIQIAGAQAAFEKAITLDPAAPLARLGLGLTLIRRGHLNGGTREIEIAAILDPNNALIRSYLGKAYYEQKRTRLAQTEFEIAKTLDPSDPTPWFYGAILKQSINRPVDALRDLRRSMALNDNRAVYRSRLLLDEDAAARSASLARIYQGLGFEQLALLEGWKSVTDTPNNYSAHRFLADAYATLPRHEIARVSQLLQSQLLQPLNIKPVQPLMQETDLLLLQGSGPADAGFNEFNPLFTRNGAAVLADGFLGNHSTRGDNLILSAIHDRFMASLGQYYFRTDGSRQNDDLRHKIYDVFAQGMVTPKLSLQAQWRHRDTDSGDVQLRAGPQDLDLDQDIDQDTVRVGARYRPAPEQDLIGSFIYQDAQGKTRDTEPFLANGSIEIALDDKVDGTESELQHIYRTERFSTVVGAGYVDLDSRQDRRLQGFIGPIQVLEVSQRFHDHPKHYNTYAYVPMALDLHAPMTLTLGASFDAFDGAGVDEKRFNPKLGLLWNPLPSTTIRAAAFRVLKRALVANQTIEPTQVAGFNQFFDDIDGAKSKRYGLGWDQGLPFHVHMGAELSWRRVSQVVRLSDRESRREDHKERFHRAYLYWTPTARVAASASLLFEDFHTDDVRRAFPKAMHTYTAPWSVKYFHPSGYFASLGGSYVNQDLNLRSINSPQGGHEQQDFWVFDLTVGYRLPKRLGILSLGVHNLFDKDFDYQSSFNPEQPLASRFQPERSVLAKLNLWLY